MSMNVYFCCLCLIVRVVESADKVWNSTLKSFFISLSVMSLNTSSKSLSLKHSINAS